MTKVLVPEIIELGHKTFPPFKHQAEILARTGHLPGWALFWEMGCAKTRPILDTFASLAIRGEVSGLLVVGPNGMYRNWVDREVPTHLVDEIGRECYGFSYVSAKGPTKRHQAAAERLFNSRYSILAMSYSGLVTARGKALAKRFLTERKCLYVLDEATRIKTPRARRTKTVLASGKLAPYRRVLTGTPVANNAFDVYTLIKFLDPHFWKQHGLGTFAAFKSYFGVFVEGRNGGRMFKQLVAHKNLDQLNKILATISDRLTKDQVLDLPPKLYNTVMFDMSKEQRAAYNALTKQFLLEMDGGHEVDATLPIVRQMRLRQVVSNYVGTDDKKLIHLSDKNPRLECLAQILEDVHHDCIVWAEFTEDVDQICALIGDRCVRYDGQVKSAAQRDANLERFVNGDAQFFVAKPCVAGEGLTMVNARTVVYYNNSFVLPNRQQSEDRPHRPGQVHPVQYYDIVARDTVDERIVEALVKKNDISRTILGDEFKEWLKG